MCRDASSMLQLDLQASLPRPVIALGSELKNTVCAGRERTLFVSRVHADLGQSTDLRAFHEAVSKLVKTLELPMTDLVWAFDLHPGFTGAKVVRRLGVRSVAVQHHYAHALSCVADSRVQLPVIAIVGDGMGYGADGTIWGGELLVCSQDTFERVGHLRRFKLPGGDAASRRPWRVALSLWLESGAPSEAADIESLHSATKEEIAVVKRQWASGLNSPQCSSLGRIFDAVACLSGVSDGSPQEGEAARALESAARGMSADPLSFELLDDQRVIELDWRPMICDVVRSRRAGMNSTAIAAAFHATLIDMFAGAAEQIGHRTGIQQVVLSGGCFFNAILREGLAQKLRNSGMQVATHRVVSTGDAGLSVGQAVAAAHTGLGE